MSTKTYTPGDWVVFTMTKFSANPGPRASNIHPTSGGEEYAYTVDKFWIVVEVRDNGEVVLQTRRGKRHVVPANDFRLRRASMIENHRHRNRYTEILRGINSVD